MSGDKVIFGHTLEAMFLKGWPATDPRLVKAYAAAGLDVTKPFKSAYDYQVWTDCLREQARILLPELSPEQARYRQGVRFIESYFETTVGKALLFAIKVIGPRRTLTRMTRNFRSGNNFSEVTISDLGPETYELAINDVFAEGPELVMGLLQRGLELGGTVARVKATFSSGQAAVLLVDWSRQ